MANNPRLPPVNNLFSFEDDEETDERPKVTKKEKNRQRGRRDWRLENEEVAPLKKATSRAKIPIYEDPEDYLDEDF